jgi:hypothetical protein
MTIQNQSVVDYFNSRGISKEALALISNEVTFDTSGFKGKVWLKCYPKGGKRHQVRMIAPSVAPWTWDGKGSGDTSIALGLTEALTEEVLFIANGVVGYVTLRGEILKSKAGVISLFGERNKQKEVAEQIGLYENVKLVVWLCDNDATGYDAAKDMCWALLNNGYKGEYVALAYPDAHLLKKGYDINDAWLDSNQTLNLSALISFPKVIYANLSPDCISKVDFTKKSAGTTEYKGNGKCNPDLVAAVNVALSKLEYTGRDREWRGKQKIWGPNQDAAKPNNSPKYVIERDADGVPWRLLGVAGDTHHYGLPAVARFLGLTPESYYRECSHAPVKLKGRFVRPAPVPAQAPVQVEEPEEELVYLGPSEEPDCSYDDEQTEANYGEEPPDFFEGWEPEEHEPAEAEELIYLAEPWVSEENALSAGEAAARAILADQTQGSISGHLLCRAHVVAQIRERLIHVTPYPLFTCPELPGVVLEEIKPGLWKNTKGALHGLWWAQVTLALRAYFGL